MDKKREAEGVRELGIIAVILTGLKIIGLILLALLIILLVIIALFLFVPFAYRFRIKYIAGKLSLQGEIKFLFKLIYARFLYDNELSYGLKLAFHTLASSEKRPEKKKAKLIKEAPIKEKTKEKDGKENVVAEQIKNEPQEQNVDSKAKTEYESKEKSETGIKEDTVSEKKSESDIKDEAILKKKSESDTGEDAKSEKRSEVNKESASEEKILPDEKNGKKEKKTVNKKIKKTKKKFNIISKIKQIIENIKAKWKVFKDRFKSLNIKKDAIIRFLNADGTLSGAGYLLTQGKRLIKMIFPKKIEGWLKFGTGDVYTEGQYLSYLCLLYPLYGRKFEIRPEWDEEVFETDAAFSGRITMFIILLVILKVLFNKKVKLLRNNYNRCKKSLAKS